MIIHSIKLWQHKTILILKYICSQKYHQIKIPFWCTVYSLLLLWLTDCQDSSNISKSIKIRFTDRNVFCWWEIASLSLQKIADVIINDTLHWFLGPWGIVCNTINIRIQIINSPKVVVYFSKKKEYSFNVHEYKLCYCSVWSYSKYYLWRLPLQFMHKKITFLEM